mmetsp:Transcript_16883/g.36440  ORF Transcript_16883/g.36440 Transcript_16883/m.36440 type:complete len:1529 (+) Transcript_16883:101-4687(+)
MNNNMGWLNNSSNPEGDHTSDTQSDRSASPTNNNGTTINTSSNSNSQIISTLSTMEAAHLNQLHEVTSEMAERELLYKEENNNKEMQLQQSHNRVSAVERRIRERDAQMSSLKEEKAGCMRQIADLKNQLYQLQFEVEETTSDKADLDNQWQAKLADAHRELSDAKRALDEALHSQVNTVTKATNAEQENNDLKKQLKQNQGNQANEVAALQQQLSQLKITNASLTTQIAEERSSTTKNKQLNTKEMTNLRSMLRARDDAIQSLQGRVEKGQDGMTALEAELDDLRGEKQTVEDATMKEREDQVNTLLAENEEMNRLVEKQNEALKTMTAKWDGQKEECQEQCSLAEQRGEEINQLKLALQEEALEKEESLVRSNSGHSRSTALEVELQTMNEKVDELTSALNESMEEIEDLQADVVFKEGRIASLEKEIEEASTLLEAPHDNEDSVSHPSSSSPGRRESGNFARLRQEIKKVTRERARLESDHALQLSLLKTSKDCDIIKVEKELGEVRAQLADETKKLIATKHSLQEVESSQADLRHELEKTREVMDQLDAEEDRELEEMKQNVQEVQLANDKLQSEIEEVRTKLKDKERELAKKEVSAEGELREAQQALIALDMERRSPSRERDDGNAKIEALNEQLSACKEQIRSSEAKLGQTVREKEMIISDLKSELSSKEKYADDMQDELESLQLTVDRGPSKRNYGMSIDPEWHEPDTISKLKVQMSALGKEKKMMENELRAKIDTRDATIATLVLSSSNQEVSIADLKSEVNRLQLLVDSKSSTESDVSQQLKDLEATRRREVDSLKDRTHDLTIELKQTNRELLSVTEELECAKSQLEAADTMLDVQDLAGRLVISEQTQKMLKTENIDKLKERDSAITNLLHSVQANQGVISNLRADIESFRAKLNDSVQENRRLQHESEIFAQQIIDQDEEFEGLNTRLKDKTSEVASLKREIASSSAEVRNMKSLQSQLDELREEKRHNHSHINRLEGELRDVELKKAEEDGFEVERLKLELKNAITDNEAMEERLTKQIDSLRKLRNRAVEDFEVKLRDREGQISSLEKELLELREKVSEDDFDDIFLDEKTGQSKKQLMEERDMLLVKIEELCEETESLRASSDSYELSELKSKLAHSERLREELEKDRSASHSSKDREMDRLHRQLSEARESQTARELEQLSLLKNLECENGEIREEFSIRMMEKNSKIVALEQTLAAQEQVVGNMSSEMDQLQNGMEKISVQRRAEIEEMQEELMDYTSKSTRLEREVMALSMKLDDKKLKHKTEMAKLKDKISTLESETPLERIVHHDKHDDRQRESELEEKNEHLKWLNSSLKDETRKLKEKVGLLKASNAKNKKEDSMSSKSAKNNDKWRNVALQEQVAVLSQRVIELEEVASVATQRRPPQSTRPSILHSPVMRSSLEMGSASSAARSLSSSPKSALRSSTNDGTNQTNDHLLSNSEEERGHLNVRSVGTPSLPRPGNSTPKSLEKSRGSKSSSRFSLRKKSSKQDRLSSSPKFDDASNSNSTANYDF